MSAGDRDKWNARFAERGTPGDPSDAVLELERFLPTTGRALDVAGGAGRHALWLARRGLEVTLVDVSDAGLEVARAAAAAERLPVTTIRLDLEAEPPPAGPWDLIVCTFFLDRAVYERLPDLLAPGGTLVIVHPTRKNLERNPKPPAEFLLAPGELFELARDLEVVHFDEAWGVGGRHDARLVARRRR